jgi:hypothetical protein
MQEEFESTVESVTETPLDGQVEANAETGDALVEEPREYFAWDEYADKPVKLTVDGEEIEVPLAEALNGYQRQADYTRKTQELAEQRRQVQFAAALQEALQNDPNGTLELLSQHYGVNQKPTSEEDEFLDPVEKQYRQLESRIQAFEQEKAMRELENQIESLSRRYGELFDANEVVAKALATGNTNLEAVYKQIAFDRLYEQSRNPKTVAQAAKSEETKKIVDAKREAAVVSKGASAKSADVSSKPIRSVRDAFESAKRQLEG